MLGSTTNFKHRTTCNYAGNRSTELCKSIEIKRGLALRENYNFTVDILYNCINRM